MYTHRKHYLIAATLAVMTATAGAQTAMSASGDSDGHHAAAGQHGPRGERPDPSRFAQHMAERHARHLAELKAKLQITTSQEAAWNQFATAIQPPVIDSQRPDRAAFEKMTTPQRIDAMLQRVDERQAQMHQRGEAVKNFYAQLTPEQQKIFDARGLGMMGMHGKGHPGHDGPPPPPPPHERDTRPHDEPLRR